MPTKKNKHGKVVDCFMLNVREKPLITSDVKVVIFDGASVDVITKIHGEIEWYKIETATGEIGFVMCDYIAIYDKE